MKFIIEHLEPELFEWCLIEYEHISKIVGKNDLIFTNIKNKNDVSKLKKFGNVFDGSFSELNNKLNFNKNKICILSQYAQKTLETNDKNKFEYFVFGGILGDKPAKRRTEDIIKELKQNKIKFEERNLKSAQMPTDNAVYASKKILDGAKLNELKFIDEVEIQINDNESVSLPFRYIIDDNKLIISEKLVEHLRNREEF
ncbi:MAG: SAM-dependent methyltransferase [Nanoarchaeota archaeon]